MFTLEDLDLTQELEAFRADGMDVMHVHADRTTSDDEPVTLPEANARLHPDDYLIVGL